MDGVAEAVGGGRALVARVPRCRRDRGPARAPTRPSAATFWRVRRELSLALRAIAPLKFNHDVVVPRGRVPSCSRWSTGSREEHRLRIPCFGHAGDGNIHVNIMVDAGRRGRDARARTQAERELFEGVVALEGSISGEHGIGFSKATYLPLELSPDGSR